MVDKVPFIWHDGKLISWENATVHLMTHSLHYGYAAFEGIRCYAQTAGGAAIFRLQEHLTRLYHTAQICMLDVPFQKEELAQACREVVRSNGLLDGCYLRPLVYMGEGAMGIAAISNPIRVAIMAWRWGAYVGDEGLKNGIRAKVSSFRRGTGDAVLAKGKITGQYVTPILAKREALKAGYQEAILLDNQGYVAEASGENLFMVEPGPVVRTPSRGQPILNGITHQTVLQLFADMKIPVQVGPFTRDELYCADEIFLTGTAAEITPVRELDDRRIGIGRPGPVTTALQERYARLVRGELGEYKNWLTPV
jgi:branched-chain amino acid aminotransferase